MRILIGGAWPYAIYKLHLGHVAGLIGGDLLARYHRAKGDDVLYVSGSDCHGTPITERAKKEGTTPEEICEKYHANFVQTFNALSFSYDLYTKTETPYHAEKVKEMQIENVEEQLKKDIAKETKELPSDKHITKVEIRKTEFAFLLLFLSLKILLHKVPLLAHFHFLLVLQLFLIHMVFLIHNFLFLLDKYFYHYLIQLHFSFYH